MLNATTFDQLIELFEENNWDTDAADNQLFDRFSNVLDKLNQEDQDFILKLTKSYRVYNLQDYEEMLKECLIKMDSNNYFERTEKEIIVAPLLCYNKGIYNIKEPKSSNLMSYLMKSDNLSYLNFMNEAGLKVVSYLDSKDIDLIKMGKAQLLLIDDFIGSGSTARKAINSYLKTGIVPEQITVITLLIDGTGKEVLDYLNINYFTSNKEYFTLYDLEEDIPAVKQKIRRISKKVGATKSYELGYNKTMALLSLVRTPNNTIPFYWVSKKFKAPFSRFEGEKK